MKTAIIGCGAMGTVLGAYMTKNGFDVDLVDSYKAHVDALNKNGARIVGHVDFTVPVHALLPEHMQGEYDLLILLTKQTANSVVLPNILKHLPESGTVLTLQNGVPEPYVAEYAGQRRTVGGTVHWGATFLGPGVSELTQDIRKNDHLFEIGEIDGSVGSRIEEVAGVLGYMGKAHITNVLMNIRWVKLVSNACMSGMSAALGSVFGAIINNEKALACLGYLGHEVRMCCESAGYKLTELMNCQSPDSLDLADKDMLEESKRMFTRMYDGMHTAKASMLQDLEAGRITEVNYINGHVCSTGRKNGISTPFNDKIVEIITKIGAGKLPLSIENISEFDDGMFRYGF